MLVLTVGTRLVNKTHYKICSYEMSLFAFVVVFFLLAPKSAKTNRDKSDSGSEGWRVRPNELHDKYFRINDII